MSLGVALGRRPRVAEANTELSPLQTNPNSPFNIPVLGRLRYLAANG